jgi:hypothetical protein
MKIDTVERNNRRNAFLVEADGKTYVFPYSKAEPSPCRDNPVERLWIDDELAREGFSFTLRSGAEGVVLMDQVLDYNRDPGYLRRRLLYGLTLEAQRRLATSPLSRREIVRRMSTSAPQLYRLLDPTNTTKTVDQMVTLLTVLDCDVDMVVREKVA